MIFDKVKRAELKKELKELAALIPKLKDQRKTKRPKRFPDFVRQPGQWLDDVQNEFRHKHIAASMMRGKSLKEIETLPKGWEWVRDKARYIVDGKQVSGCMADKWYHQPSMKWVGELVLEHVLEDSKDKISFNPTLGRVVFNEDVCISSEDPFKVSAGSPSRTRIG